MGADADELEGARCGDRDEPLDLLVELSDLVLELIDAAGEAAQGELGGPGGLVDALAVRAQVQAEIGSGLERAAAAELAA